MKINKESARLIIHPKESIGAPSWIVWNSKHCVIGYQSKDKLILDNLEAGEYELEISGEYFFAKGYMPNPMYEMHGINLTSWSIKGDK